MKLQKMLVSLHTSEDEGIVRAVTTEIDPQALQDLIVEMHDQLMNKDIPTF